MDANPVLCDHVHLPVQSGSTPRAGRHGPALHARRVHAPHRVDEERASATIAITTDIIVGFPGETEAGFPADARSAGRGPVRFAVQLQVFAAARTRRRSQWRTSIPEEEKQRRLADRAGEAARHPDPPQRRADRQHPGGAGGRAATRRWGSGSAAPRSNRTLNFTHPRQDGETLLGTYLPVRVTRSGPNSLVGESVQLWCNREWGRAATMEVEMKIRGLDDGSRDQHAHRHPEGHQRQHGAAHLGRHLRSQRHCARNRKGLHAAADDARPDQEPAARA